MLTGKNNLSEETEVVQIMIVSFLRAAILYPVVIFAVRLMGKRQIGELQPTELVVTILISNIATLPLENQDLPLLLGLITVLSLVCFEVLMSYWTLHSRKMRRLVSGRPQIVIRDGKIIQQAMAELRLSLDDLMTALRSNQIFDIGQVQVAVVETNGAVSVYQKQSYQPVTCGDLHISGGAQNPPEILISDGSVSREGMRAAGYNREKLMSFLKKKHLKPSDVFLLTVNENGTEQFIRKERAKR